MVTRTLRRLTVAFIVAIAAQGICEAETVCVKGGLTSLKMLGADVAGVATREWPTLGFGGIAAAALHPLDDDADRWVDTHAPSPHTKVGRQAGAVPAQAVLIGSVILATSLPAECFSTEGANFARAALLNLGLTTAIKFAVRRERPNHLERVSFPSGHTSSTFALATVAQQQYGWKFGLPAYVVAAYTGWSRVRDDKHWISDTVFGAALGVAVGRATVRNGRDPKWAFVPGTTHGGASFSITRVQR